LLLASRRHKQYEQRRQVAVVDGAACCTLMPAGIMALLQLRSAD